MKILSLLFLFSLNTNQAIGATFVDTITKSWQNSGCSSVKSSDSQNNLPLRVQIKKSSR